MIIWETVLPPPIGWLLWTHYFTFSYWLIICDSLFKLLPLVDYFQHIVSHPPIGWLFGIVCFTSSHWLITLNTLFYFLPLAYYLWQSVSTPPIGWLIWTHCFTFSHWLIEMRSEYFWTFIGANDFQRSLSARIQRWYYPFSFFSRSLGQF